MAKEEQKLKDSDLLQLFDLAGGDDAMAVDRDYIISLSLEDKFWLEDYMSRKIFLNGVIDEESSQEVVSRILRYNVIDKGKPVEERRPIWLFCTSDGGYLYEGFSIIDTITASQTPVYTVNLSYQFSMGFLIGIAGRKRFAHKNAIFLMHEGNSELVGGALKKVLDQVAFYQKNAERVREHVLSHSNLSSEKYDEKFHSEWFMYSEEAKDNGFVDYIIGVDCDLDDVV